MIELIGIGARRTKVDTKKSGMRAAASRAGHCNLTSIALRVFVAAGLAAALAGCMGYVPARQTYWDSKVREMCEKDGGVTVYEKVRISKSDIGRGILPMAADGRLGFTTKKLAHPDAPVYGVDNISIIRERNPRVTRTEYIVKKRSEDKVVARWVMYSRAGGDIPTGISEASSLVCPDAQMMTTTLHDKLFDITGD